MATHKMPNIPDSWMERIGSEFESEYMVVLREFLVREKAEGKIIYPYSSNWFSALQLTEFDDVRVVIIGQDPYHGPGQAHGLCFSVPEGIAIPPSLINIYKELELDLQLQKPMHGNLTSWAKQGVLLLNASLTVEAHRAGSHQNKGWELFTDAIINALVSEKENLVFLLWGSYAQKKGSFIDASKHCVLKAPHPSPLSAHRGFLGCGHFSMTNKYLADNNYAVVDWDIR